MNEPPHVPSSADGLASEPCLCEGCGNTLDAADPGSVCSECLMQVGFESHVQADAQPSDQASQNHESQPGSEATSSGAALDQSDELSMSEVQTLFPSLSILQLIGRGGMGIVYKAEQKHLGRLVALKLLRGKCSQDPSLAERFTREARALAKLAHPNIVGVHDFGQAGDRPYLIMEYIDGTNLRHMLAEKTLTPSAALAMISPICDALQFAHEEGIVHRDIKPENILIDRRGRVRIADFGLARLMTRTENEWTLTGTRQVMGTPHYMAPEQMERPQEVDHRADIFSLGVVIYEMLTGELPLGRFDLPSKKIDIDVRLDRIVLRTLEKEPSRRYQHASEVQSDVAQFSNSSTTQPADVKFDFTRPAVYIPACGFLIASFIDSFVGVICLLGFLESGRRNSEFFVGAAHILAALPLALGGWKMLRGGSREWARLVAIFGLLPLHFGAWLSIPCSIWTLVMLERGRTTARYFGQTSSHPNHDWGAKLEASVAHVQAMGGAAARHTQQFSQRTVARIGRIAWLRIFGGLAACLAWLTLCGLAALLFLFGWGGWGGYERFPSTVRVVDLSADRVKLKGSDDLYLQIQANGGSDQANGFTQLPNRELRDNVSLSLFRVMDKDLHIEQKTGRAANGRNLFASTSTRNVYSSQGLLAHTTGQGPWEYRLGRILIGGQIEVEPHLLLADDLGSLNLNAMAPQGPLFAPALASQAGSPIYESLPTLSDPAPIVAWLATTGLEANLCQAYGESLFATLNRLRAGDGITQDADRQTRIKPLAAMLDLDLFQPQGGQRLHVVIGPQTLAIWLWGAAVAGAGLLGCLAIVFWTSRSGRKLPIKQSLT